MGGQNKNASYTDGKTVPQEKLEALKKDLLAKGYDKAGIPTMMKRIRDCKTKEEVDGRIHSWLNAPPEKVKSNSKIYVREATSEFA